MTPEEKARQQIDAMLVASGWVVQTKEKINLFAGRGVALCELTFKTGEPDYTLFVDAKAIGTIEAKPAGTTKSDALSIRQTPSGISENPSRTRQTPSETSPALPYALPDLARAFPLPWSHYVLLISRTRSPESFAFYHTEALRGGWSVPKRLEELNEVFAA